MQAAQPLHATGCWAALYDQRAVLRKYDQPDLRIWAWQRLIHDLLRGHRCPVLDQRQLLPALLVCLRGLPHVAIAKRVLAIEGNPGAREADRNLRRGGRERNR